MLDIQYRLDQRGEEQGAGSMGEDGVIPYQKGFRANKFIDA
ncbi:hypothetical protein [Nostoc sphaeroides]|nr:hypothetical protein [Nostoc sphaeroides]